MSLLGRLFPGDHPGVGPIGRAFLRAFDPPRERRILLPPSGTGIGRKRNEDPAPYAAPIVRHHQEWPGGPRPGSGPQHQPWPYERWPGERR